MRHRRADKKLNRSYSLRKSTIRDIAKSVITHQSIKTTIAKAKESQKLVDRLISLGKRGDLHSKRLAYSMLCDHSLVSILFTDIAPRFDRINGGYSRILPWINRKGDNAQLAVLELAIKKPQSEDKDKQRLAEKQVGKGAKVKPVPKEKKSKPKVKIEMTEEELKLQKTEMKEVTIETPKKEEQLEQKIVDKQIKPEKPQKPEESQGKLLKGIRKLFKKD